MHGKRINPSIGDGFQLAPGDFIGDLLAFGQLFQFTCRVHIPILRDRWREHRAFRLLFERQTVVQGVAFGLEAAFCAPDLMARAVLLHPPADCDAGRPGLAASVGRPRTIPALMAPERGFTLEHTSAVTAQHGIVRDFSFTSWTNHAYLLENPGVT